MALNKSKGNMYGFVTHTWNTVKGVCPHGCGYCYMKGMAKRFCKSQSPVHFDEKELKTNLGEGNFIFVGSSNDLFANFHPNDWICDTLGHCSIYDKNRYLFQSKNPRRIYNFNKFKCFKNSIVGTTIETNRLNQYMGNAPHPAERSFYLRKINQLGIDTFVTVEPIMDFDLSDLLKLIKNVNPIQVNIGADSGHNLLPEPTKEKVMELISALDEFTIVKRKPNLSRILKS